MVAGVVRLPAATEVEPPSLLPVGPRRSAFPQPQCLLRPLRMLLPPGRPRLPLRAATEVMETERQERETVRRWVAAKHEVR